MNTISLAPILDPLVQLAGLILTGFVSWAALQVANHAKINAQSSLFQSVLGAIDRGITYAQNTALANVNAHDKIAVQSATQAGAANYVVSKMPGALKSLGITPDSLADIVLAKLPPPVTPPAPEPNVQAPSAPQ